MRYLYIAFFLTCNALLTFGQAVYTAEGIPKELLSYASAITREDQTVVEVVDKENVIYHHKLVRTILNENGEHYARMVLWHNKWRSVRSVKGFIYNEFGKQIAKFSDSDFEDDNYINDATLYDDVKLKHYKPSAASYPYTIEYNYEIRAKQTLNIDGWETIPGDNIAVEHTSYTLICPADFKFGLKEINYTGSPQKGNTSDGKTFYKWEANKLKALRDEPYSPDESTYITSVDIAPQNFAYEGYTGSYTNWNELGKWYYDKLLAGRTKLSPTREEEMRTLTKDIASPKEKARKIYNYMQHKTHYVSIQIGIGGYQPFPATDVDATNYGDCKALVNYMQALLKAVNIDSYFCVVKSGSEKISMSPNFASMGQADHVILCLPFKSDTTWLECTSQSIPFGFLGSFTDDRTVLACTPEGGKLLHTPKYTAIQNREDKTAEFTLLDNGTISGTMTTLFTGHQYQYREHYLGESFADKVKNIAKAYPINNMEVENLTFEPEKKVLPDIKETIKLKAAEYASADAGRLIFIVNAANRTSNQLKNIRNRVTPLYINRGFLDDEKITYNLPAGYKQDSAPLDIDISKKWGIYKAQLKQVGNQLVYTRKFQLNDGTYAKEDYNDFADFYQSVYDADHFTVTLVKK